MINGNLIDIFAESIKNNWTSIALSEYVTQKQLTYGELAARIAEHHIFYHKIGIKRGDKIAICGKNSIAWSCCYLAALTYGAVVVPILEEFNPNDVQHILLHSESVLLFADNTIGHEIRFNDLPQLKAIISLNDNSLTQFNAGSGIKRELHSIRQHIKYKYPRGFSKSDVKYPHIDENTLAMICYTSGTTSLTKGVMLSLNNIAGNVMFGVNNYETTLGIKLHGSLCMLPMAHTYILSFSFLTQIAAGANTTILGKIPSPAIVTKACRDTKPTLLFFVPLVLEKIYYNRVKPLIDKPVVRFLLQTPLIGKLLYRTIGRKVYKSLGGAAEDIIIGGAALNAEVEDFFLKTGLPFTVGYGMTECAPLISYIHHSEFVARSVGKVLPGIMEAKIIKESESDTNGEIAVRGKNVMLGYYKDEEATAKTFTEDGWLKTGDLGYIDENGYIYISGRSKTLILGPNGENIHPESIESKLQNLPLVSDCIILKNDRNKLDAWVYPDYEMAESMGVSRETIPLVMEDNRRTLNSMLARYESVTAINICNEPLPKTPKRTVKRYVAEAMIKEQIEATKN